MTRTEMLEAGDAYALWAESYPARAHNPVMQAEERALLALIPADLAGCAVLDAGCGSGRYLLHALRRGATRLIGVDLAPAMLERAREELRDAACRSELDLREGSIAALPVADAWADLVVCALVIGHLENLQAALGELHRVVRPGGIVVCSDVHPLGAALGWQRDFKHAGRRYAVRHTMHSHAAWHAACAAVGFVIERVLEPYLDPADIPADAHFDRRALDIPVALALRLRREPRSEVR